MDWSRTLRNLRARGRVAYPVACLFLLQMFSFVLLPNARAAFSDRVPTAALSMAGELCDARAHDGGKAPAPSHHRHQHCTLCVAGNRDLSLDDAGVLIATVIVLALPRSDAAPAWVGRHEFEPWLPGWMSSWSSRAPPFLS
jgi:hypothetical protein